jgi:hypothetical protein
MPPIAMDTFAVELVDDLFLPFKSLKEHVAEAYQNAGNPVFAIVSN